MTQQSSARSSASRLLRRSRVVSVGTAAGASLVTIGLIAGVAHSQAATTGSGTTSTKSSKSGTSSSSNSSNSSNSSGSGSSGSSGNVQQAPMQQQPVGGSHGS
jgi:hypothetical protein